MFTIRKLTYSKNLLALTITFQAFLFTHKSEAHSNILESRCFSRNGSFFTNIAATAKENANLALKEKALSFIMTNASGSHIGRQEYQLVMDKKGRLLFEQQIFKAINISTLKDHLLFIRVKKMSCEIVEMYMVNTQFQNALQSLGWGIIDLTPAPTN